MLYQLTNGKVIYLSIEEYLSLTDLELHELANSGYGDEAPSSMFFGRQQIDNNDFEDADDTEIISLEFITENDETNLTAPLNLDYFEED